MKQGKVYINREAIRELNGYTFRLGVIEEKDDGPYLSRDDALDIPADARAAECVNALEGLNPSAIRELVEAAERALKFSDHPRNTSDEEELCDALRSALDKIKE